MEPAAAPLAIPAVPTQEIETTTMQKQSDSSCSRPCCATGESAPTVDYQPSEAPKLSSPTIPVIGERPPADAAEAQAQAHAAFLAVSRDFSCHWEGCMMRFRNQQDLISHIVLHATTAAPSTTAATTTTTTPFVVVSQPATSASGTTTTTVLTTNKPEEIVPLLLHSTTTAAAPASLSSAAVASAVPSSATTKATTTTVVVTACPDPAHHIVASPVAAAAAAAVVSPGAIICTENHPHTHHHLHHQQQYQQYQQYHHSDSAEDSDSDQQQQQRRGGSSKKRKGSTIKETDDLAQLSPEDRKYPCDIDGCEKAFKRTGHLKRHKLVHQPRDARQRFHCSETGCAKNYSTKYDLSAHIRQVHRGMQLFKCSVRGCCRRFVKQDSLLKHITTFDHSKQHAESHREEGEFTDELDLVEVLHAAQMQVAELQNSQQQQQQQPPPQSNNLGNMSPTAPALNLVTSAMFNPFTGGTLSPEFVATLSQPLLQQPQAENASPAATIAPATPASPADAQDMRSFAPYFQSR